MSDEMLRRLAGNSSEQWAPSEAQWLAVELGHAQAAPGTYKAAARVLRELEAEVVGLREQLAAAEQVAERESEIARAHEHELGVLRGNLAKAEAAASINWDAFIKWRDRAKVAVGRLEKAQAALREIRDVDLSKVIGPPIHALLEIATDALEEIRLGDALGNMTPEEKP